MIVVTVIFSVLFSALYFFGDLDINELLKGVSAFLPAIVIGLVIIFALGLLLKTTTRILLYISSRLK